MEGCVLVGGYYQGGGEGAFSVCWMTHSTCLFNWSFLHLILYFSIKLISATTTNIFYNNANNRIHVCWLSEWCLTRNGCFGTRGPNMKTLLIWSFSWLCQWPLAPGTLQERRGRGGSQEILFCSRLKQIAFFSHPVRLCVAFLEIFANSVTLQRRCPSFSLKGKFKTNIYLCCFTNSA